MKDNLLHTPEGVRDIYGEECIIKERTENAIKNCIKKYGYEQIKTPTFEYFDIFNSERGTVSSRDMYKFIDRDGETLVLRPDITPEVARCIAKYFCDETLPVRLFYEGNIFINNSGYMGKLKEFTQIGVENVNSCGADADSEVIALMIDSLNAAGLNEFQVEIGNADFFRGICAEAGFSDSETAEMRDLIETKNIFGVHELLEEKNIDPELKNILSDLPLEFGTIDFVKDIKSKIKNETAISALDRILDVYEKLSAYGFESHVTVDLGMLTHYDYYTGIVFKAYTHKMGEAIAGGGRYDKLLSQFGKPAPAIGFAINTDYTILALTRQNAVPDVMKNLTLILYSKEFENKAIKVAKQLRADGLPAATLLIDENVSEEKYEDYAKKIMAGGILYVDSADKIRLKDLYTKEIHEKDI